MKEFLQLADFNAEFTEHPLICQEQNNVYSFPLLNRSFCQRVTEEVANYLNVSQDSGVALRVSTFGFDTTVKAITEQITPLIRYLYPQLRTTVWEIYPKLMTYRVGKNEDWPIHTDGDIGTLNVCLGNEFEGTELRLYDSNQTSYKDYKHQIGRAVILLGNNHHSVTPLRSGTRYSLVIKLNELNHNY